MTGVENVKGLLEFVQGGMTGTSIEIENENENGKGDEVLGRREKRLDEGDF